MIIVLSLGIIILAIAAFRQTSKLNQVKEALEASDSVVLKVEEYLMRDRVEQEIATNPVLTGVLNKFYAQTEKGIKKYPNTVNPDDYTEDEWDRHMQEELIDAAVYLEARIQKRSGE